MIFFGITKSFTMIKMGLIAYFPSGQKNICCWKNRVLGCLNYDPRSNWDTAVDCLRSLTAKDVVSLTPNNQLPVVTLSRSLPFVGYISSGTWLVLAQHWSRWSKKRTIHQHVTLILQRFQYAGNRKFTLSCPPNKLLPDYALFLLSHHSISKWVCGVRGKC
jgi:hypothetical protein